MEDYAIVYQCGIANVFRLGSGGTDYQRIGQHSFRYAEAFCAGLREAGKRVGVFHCDQAGDISAADWERGAGDLFKSDKSPPAAWVAGRG